MNSGEGAARTLCPSTWTEQWSTWTDEWSTCTEQWSTRTDEWSTWTEQWSTWTEQWSTWTEQWSTWTEQWSTWTERPSTFGQALTGGAPEIRQGFYSCSFSGVLAAGLLLRAGALRSDFFFKPSNTT